jgi:hypothetical protein
MKHLEHALDNQNQLWKYIVNFLIAFVGGSIVGSIPLFVLVILKSIESGGAIAPNPNNAADFSVYGISSNVSLVLLILPFVVGLISSALILKPLHKRTFAEVINGTKSIRWKHLFIGFGVWFAISAVSLVVSYYSEPADFVFQMQWKTFLPLILISFMLIPFQTALEEFMFRGYLAQGIGAWTRNRWLVIIIPSLLFGLMHMANPEVNEYGFWNVMPQYVLFGLIFSLISTLDDGIETAIGMHAANNIFLSLFVTAKSSALQTAAVFEQQKINIQEETLSLIVLGLLAVIILKYIYKWDLKILGKKIELELSEEQIEI